MKRKHDDVESSTTVAAHEMLARNLDSVHKWLVLSQSESVLALMLNNGVDINEIDGEGYTALARTCDPRSIGYDNVTMMLEPLQILLRAGADPNCGPIEKRPLGFAIKEHDLARGRMISFLLQHGANAHDIVEKVHTAIFHSEIGYLGYTYFLKIFPGCPIRDILLMSYFRKYLLEPATARFYQWMKKRGCARMRIPLYVVKGIVTMAHGGSLKWSQMPN